MKGTWLGESFFCIIFQFYVTESCASKLKYSTITMFSTMKLVYLFVAASLMLVGAIVVIAMPNPIEASPPFQWCTIAGCFKTKVECDRSSKEKNDCFKSKI